MSTLGNQTTPASGFQFIGSSQAAASQFVMPSGGGVVTQINGYFDSENSSQTGYLCVWDNSGNLLVASSGFGVNNKAGSGAGGQDWWSASVTPTYVPAGTIWIGFLATGSLVFSSENAGTSTGVANTSNIKGMSSPSSFAGSSGSAVGAVGAYITYTPGGIIRVNTGTPGAPNWALTQLKVNTGTSGSPVWTFARVRVNQGTPGTPNWVDAT